MDSSAAFHQDFNIDNSSTSLEHTRRQASEEKHTFASLLKKPLTLRVSGSSKIVCFSRRNDDTSSPPQSA